jgi:hypothetical protein
VDRPTCSFPKFVEILQANQVLHNICIISDINPR